MYPDVAEADTGNFVASLRGDRGVWQVFHRRLDCCRTCAVYKKKKGGGRGYSRTCHTVGGIITDAATDTDRDTDADGVTDTDTDTHTYRYTY